MSFYFGLLLAVPNTEELKTEKPTFSKVERKVWGVEGIWDLSIAASAGSTGFEKLSSRRRAKTYLLDMLWPALTKYLERRELEFPPKFLLHKDDLSRYPDKFPNEFVRPWLRRQIVKEFANQVVCPSQRVMQNHNEDLLAKYLPRTLDDLKRPDYWAVPWIPCADLAHMIDVRKLEDKNDFFDMEPLAYIRIWSTIAYNLGQLGARAIILLHHTAEESFRIYEF